MKKIFLLLAVIVFIPIQVKAENFYTGQQIKDVPIYLDKITNKSYRYFKTAYRKSDDVLVYCVEPEKLLSLEQDYTYVTENQWEKLNISKEKWRRIELLGYYGYGYKNHTNEKWAAITQYMIWQTVLPVGWFLTFTDGYEGAFKNVHEAEVKELESLIKNFETKPSFENEVFKITKNNELILKDTNEVLANYKLIDKTDLDISISDNELIIKGTKNGEYTLKFVRGTYKPTKLYLSAENQAVISADGEPENSFKITVVVESGDLILKRNHNDYLENDSTEENATYEIIDSEANKYILTTNKDGEINLFDLPLGDVKIRELNPSIGYEKDEKKYTVSIENNSETIINTFPKLIVKRINVVKKYLDDNKLKEEFNSIFSVIKNGEMKMSTKTNSFGRVSFIIPYGNYVIKQDTTLLGYELMPDYEIFIENTEEETLKFINYKKVEIEENPKKPVEEDNSKEEKPNIENHPSYNVPNVSEDDESINIEKDGMKQDDEKENINEVVSDNEENATNIIDGEINYEVPTTETNDLPPTQNNFNEENAQNQIIIDNPKTGDNLLKYISILFISYLVLGKIIRKMQ